MSLLPLAERDDEFLDEAALRARYPYPILLFASYCFLLTAHYLLLTTYYLLLTAYSRMHAFALCRTEAGWWPLLTTHYSLLTTHYSLLVSPCAYRTPTFTLATTLTLRRTSPTAPYQARYPGYSARAVAALQRLDFGSVNYELIAQLVRVVSIHSCKYKYT